MFSVRLGSQPMHFLKKANNELKNRLIEKLEKLRGDQIPHDAKMVLGTNEKTFRVRVGDYRILYNVYFPENVIFISKIDKRSKAYL